MKGLSVQKKDLPVLYAHSKIGYKASALFLLDFQWSTFLIAHQHP